MNLFGATLAQAATDPDAQSWTQVFVQGTLAGKFKGFMELQPRVDDNISRMDRLLVRPAAGYQTAPKSSVWLGYLFQPTFHGSRVDEHRIWQQFMNESPRGSFTLFNRTRLEERFLPGAPDVAVRLRHMIRTLFAIDSEAAWSVAAFDEIFFNLNHVSAGPEPGFDQNRLFVGVSRLFKPTVRIEPGYMLNYVSQAAPRPDRMNHNLFVMVAITLP